MSDEKKYIYWYTDMKQPLDLTGWEWQRQFGFASWDDGKELVAGQHYRKFMTAEEARVFFALQACDVECPECHRIIDFRLPMKGELVIYTRLNDTLAIHSMNCSGTLPRFILEKIERKINWVEPTDQDAIELKRPAVRFRDYEDLPWQYNGTLIGVDDSSSPYTIRRECEDNKYEDHHFVYCEMDASLREQGDK